MSAVLILPVALFSLGDPLYRLRHALLFRLCSLCLGDPIDVFALAGGTEGRKDLRRGFVLFESCGQLCRNLRSRFRRLPGPVIRLCALSAGDESGCLPVVVEHFFVWRQILHTPALPHTHCKKLPPAAEQVIRKALTKDPDQRFSCIEIFAQELGDALYSPSLLSSVTDEVVCVQKAPETADCEPRHIHTTRQHLKLPNTNRLE